MEIVGLTRGLILGLVQGVLEWLPISSSGSLFLILAFLGIPAGAAYDYSLFLHLGTVISALLLLWRHLLEKSTLKFVLAGLFSSLLAGIPLYFYFRLIASTSALAILAAALGVLLILTGLMERWAWAGGLNAREVGQLSTLDGVIVGFFQGLSVLPGLSRSGLTVVALIWRGYKLREAFKLSFTLGIPFILLGEAGLAYLEAPTLFNLEGLVGLTVAMVVGLISLKILLGVVSEKPFWIVCAALGAVSIVCSLFL